MLNSLEILLLGTVQKRLSTIKKMLSDSVYGVGIESEERVLFEKMVEDLFIHNVEKIANQAYELGKKELKRNSIDFTDASTIFQTVASLFPEVHIKQASN